MMVDRELALWCEALRDSMPPSVQTAVEWVTGAGDSMWWLGGSAIGFAIFALCHLHNRARVALALFAAVGLSGLAVIAMKPIIGRFRPKLLHEAGQYGFEFLRFTVGYDANSFPSGHATTIAAACAVLWRVLPRWRVLWIALWLCTSASRLLLGAHYLSDVIAGSALGAGVGLLVLATWEKRYPASAPTPLA